MKSEAPIDYAVFQLSPKRSRCELFVSSNGFTEKLASGLVKPFVTHLKVAEEQVAHAVQSIKLEVEKNRNAETWFTKGTLERFVRFVSTPEVLEMVNTFDAEMSQLEAARRIYSQGVGDQLSGALGGDGAGAIASADATKKELLRALDVRLVAVRQDLTTACARAMAAGFNHDTVSELQHFADRFGAHRLNEACIKYISLCQRRPDLINHHSWKTTGVDDRAIRSSTGSDMSIDDPTEDHLLGGSHQPYNNKQSNPSTSDHQPSKSSSSTTLRRAPNEKDQFTKSNASSVGAVVENEEVNNNNNKEEGVPEFPPPTTSQPPSRRLSVQDRINLFENKQKENSGGKPVVAVGKSVELRRLSSDVSSPTFSSSSAAAVAAAAEKAVLRRWSGASDMSIDLSGERKDVVESSSPLGAPSSVSVSQTKSSALSGLSVDKDRDTATSVKVEVKSDSGLKEQTRVGVVSFDKEEEVGGKGRRPNLKDQAATQHAQFGSFLGRGEQVGGVNDQEKLKIGSGGVEDQSEFVGIKDRETLRSEFSNRVEDVGLRDQTVGRPRLGAYLKTPVEVGLKTKGSSSTLVHSQSFPGQLEDFAGFKIQEALRVENEKEVVESDSLGAQPQWRSFPGEVEDIGKKNLPSSEKPSNEVEDSGIQKMKFQRQGIASEQMKKSQGRRGESSSSKLVFPGKKVSENQESYNSISMAPAEQVQRTRPSKGNQELNDELKLKANELEKLFAEHKLRVPGDQSTSSRRSKSSDMQIEQAASMHHRKASAEMTPEQLPAKSTLPEPTGSSSNMQKFSSRSVMANVDNQDYTSPLKQNFSELSFSDDSRGKFYDSYMKKRDAKLREDWGTKREEKEAKMKAMQDSFERSRAELKARFAGSADRQDSLSNARRRAEKLRSFNFRSSMKKEQPIDYGQSEEDEDISELREQKLYGHDRLLGETSVGDGASRTTQVRKVLPGRNLSSTPRTSATPVPRSSIKALNSVPGRRRAQLESPLAQSVPNFSEFRKENTKPSSGASKTTPRSQLRSYPRSKSGTEEVPSVKEDKARRAQSLRKSSANPVEVKDLSSLNSDGIVLAPVKFDKEQNDQSLYDKFSKNVESKPFLRKGNGIGPGAGATAAKLKASMASDSLINEVESDELAFDPEDSVDVVKEEEEEEEEEFEAAEDSFDMDNGQPSASQESDKSGHSGSENGEIIRSISQVDPASVTELPAVLPSMFQVLGSVQDSPGESPMSWNSRMHDSFSYPHETSDIDAYVDSPIGSPASWNSHSLTQTEADAAARMRKKWGSAYKPFVAANSSHNSSRKDMTKGFKRLLKFGRKNRGTESLVDWISATTSEGDDDAEDGRDLANRSSDDLRKSRMGFSQSHPSDDGFNESELYNEQVQALHSSIPTPPANFKLREDHLSGSSLKAPRSFFSLSSFRSKGSDSKTR